MVIGVGKPVATIGKLAAVPTLNVVDMLLKIGGASRVRVTAVPV